MTRMSSPGRKIAKHCTQAAAQHLQPLPGFAASEAQLRRQLLQGAHREIWEENLGVAEYRHLRKLARTAAKMHAGRGPRVYILPGIMGSKLGGKENGART